MKKLITRIRKNPIWTIAIAIVLILVILLVVSSNRPKKISTVDAFKGTATQVVSATGNTVPVHDLDLAFEKSGKVARVLAKVGDQVEEGQTIVQLDGTELQAQLEQARASLSTQEAKLEALRRGARPEDIQVTQAQLDKAKQDLVNDYGDIVNVLQDAFIKADDAVNKQVNSLFDGDNKDLEPGLTFSTSKTQYKTDAEDKRIRAGSSLQAWQNELSLLSSSSSQTELDNALKSGESHLMDVRSLLDSLMLAAKNTTDEGQTTFMGYITTARTNVNTALTSINTQKQTIASQKVLVKQYENQLELKVAGSDPEDIKAQAAQVAQAQANVDYYQAQLSKMSLRSPISGLVTKQDARVGEIIALNVPVVSVISANQLDIEANIPEVDISKLAVGQSAKMSFDAIPGEELDAKVSHIDPAEKVIEGVVTYKASFNLIKNDPRIKSGMSANIDVTTNKKDGVILVPQRVVIGDSKSSYVMIVRADGTTEKREVELGLRSFDGNIEITSGLFEGEKVAADPSQL